MKRLLLVSPRRGSDFVSEYLSSMAGRFEFPCAVMPPIDLATIKALTPPEYEVDIWDEAVDGRIDDSTDLGKSYDLFGLTGYMTHIRWALNFAGIAKRRGVPVVIGGPGVSGAPDRCRGIFDTIFIGEAEFTWPQFLADWDKRRPRSEYRQVERPELSTSPAPDWSWASEMARNYVVGPVQTTRGCPFDCDFCDVIHLFGRQSRHKPVEVVLQEVAALERLGMRRIFFCDDNYIGEPKYARELTRALIELNGTFDRPLGFATQLTLNLAKDEELLQLLADANFGPVQIGIESPRQESLREANKPQNYKTDIAADVLKIQSYGIPIRPNFIVGFDHDDVAIFDEIYEFVQKTHLATPGMGCLKAYPGTPLLARLLREGRIIEIENDHYANAAIAMTNILPKNMTRLELFKGSVELHEKVRSWETFGERVKGFIRNVKRVPRAVNKVREPDPKQAGKFIQFLMSLGQDAQTVSFALLGECERVAPWLKERVAGMIAYQAGLALTLPRLLDSFRERIEVESGPGYNPAVIRTLPRVPPGFKVMMHREPFQHTYQRLLDGLVDTHLVPEGLIRVWKDFLIRWGEIFVGRFEDYHMQYLGELCDRYIEQGNDGQFANGRVNAQIEGLNGPRLRRFAGEILVSVEQDLRGVA